MASPVHEVMFVPAMILRYGGGFGRDLVFLVMLCMDCVSRRESIMNFVSHALMDTRAESVEVSMTHIQM